MNTTVLVGGASAQISDDSASRFFAVRTEKIAALNQRVTMI